MERPLSDRYHYSPPDKFWDNSMTMRVRGTIDGGHPKGIVIHYTAGRSLNGDADAVNTINHGIAQGYCYWCVSDTGKVYKTHELDQWGHHAGISNYGKLGNYISAVTLGIEVCNAGKVDPVKGKDFYSTWWGQHYPADLVRSRPDLDGVCGGHYAKFTDAQEEAVTDIVLYVASKYPDFNLDYVLGHFEVSPNRKIDPGWSLSMSMKKYREFLKEQFKLMKG